MTTRSKRLLWALGLLVGAGAVALASAVALLPLWINTPDTRAEILAEASRALGAEVHARELSFSLVPPRFVLDVASLETPGGATLEADSVGVSPAILPLLLGRLALNSLRLVAPRLTLPLAAPPLAKGGQPLSLPSPKALSEALRPALASLPRKATVVRGEVTLLQRTGPAWHIYDVSGRLVSEAERIKLELTCSPQGAKKVTLDGWVEPNTGTSAGTFEADDVVLNRLATHLFRETPSPLDLGDSRGSLRLRWQGPDWQHATATFRSTFSPLDLVFRTSRLQSPAVAAGSLSLAPGSATAFFDRLALEKADLQGSGSLAWEAAGPSLRAHLQVPREEVEPLRELLLSTFHNVPAVGKTFDILRGGRVDGFEATVWGRSWSELAGRKNLSARAHLAAGRLHLPKVGLDVAEASGDASLAKGSLKITDLRGKAGDTAALGGELVMGLEPPGTPFRLDLDLNADLASLPRILERAIPGSQVKSQLSRIEDLKGRVRGRMHLGGSVGDLTFRVEAENLKAHCRYRPVPLPLAISGGSVSLDASRVAVSGLEGNLGASRFSGVDATWAWGERGELFVTAGTAKAQLGELVPWLSSLAGIDLPIQALSGEAELDAIRLKGPPRDPAQWRYQLKGSLDASGEATGLGQTSLQLQGVVAEPGSVSFGPGEGILPGGSVKLLGGSLHLESPLSVQVRGGGTLGAEAVARIQERLALPEAARLRGPVSASAAELSWKRDGPATLSGRLQVNGVDLRVDATRTPEALEVRKLTVTDPDSDASLMANLRGSRADLDFRGRLAGPTLDRLLERQGILTGSFDGRFHLQVARGKPADSSANGHLEVKGLTISGGGLPFRVAEASVEAHGQELRIASSTLHLGPTALDLSGTAHLAPEGLHLDLDAEAPSVTWENLGPSLVGEGGHGEADAEPVMPVSAYGLPLLGTIRLQVRELRYRTLAWKPFDARVELGTKALALDVTKADLCAISTPGSAVLSPEGLRARTRPFAEGASLDEVLTCLAGTKDLASGTLTAHAELSASGEPADLLDTVGGTFQASARKGRIHRYGLLAKIFAVLNVTEVFRGKLPDLGGEGLGYESLDAHGAVKKGVLTFEDGVLDASSLTLFWHGDWDLVKDTLDLTVLVAPFKTIDALIRHVPVLGYILGGTLVAVPVKVSGPRADPSVVPLDPTEVGSGLLNVVKRTLGLPFKVIQPLLPGGAGE